MLSSPNEGQSTMKRFLALALLIGGSTFGVVGCTETTEVKKVEEVKGPEGTKKITDKTTIEATGDQKGTTPTPETPKP
jgi:hypothetical protein